VVGRIQSAQSLADLPQIARKIYDVLKAYSGVQAAEKFMQQFEGQRNLRYHQNCVAAKRSAACRKRLLQEPLCFERPSFPAQPTKT